MEFLDEIRKAALGAVINKNIQELRAAISDCRKIAHVYSKGIIDTKLVWDSWLSLPRYEDVKIGDGTEKLMIIVLMSGDMDDSEVIFACAHTNSSFPGVSRIEYHEPTKELIQQFLNHFPDFSGRDARDIKYIKEIHDLYLADKVYTLY